MRDRSKIRIFFAMTAIGLALAAARCADRPAEREAAGPSVVPAPLRLEARPGAFTIGPATKIVIARSQAGLRSEASYLKELFARTTGFDLAIEEAAGSGEEASAPPGSIVLGIGDLEARLGDEG